MSKTRLATVGYEKATVDELIAKLRAERVTLLIDVRAVAASRRAGFSKTRLAASLDEAGIAYIHLKDLGTPKQGREAARAGRVAEMNAIYEAWLEEPQAQLALAEAEALIQEQRTALLCLEADAAHCHRRIVAEKLKARTGCTVVDL